jgi:glycosyltransferase involved in cell wall biosynthesis
VVKLKSLSPESKAIFLFYGDVIKNHRTAVYLSSFLKYLSHIWKDTDTLFFQVYLSHGDSCLKESELPKLSEAPLIKLYPYIPKIIWRFYELLYCYLKICKYLFRRVDNSITTVFVCGEALLPVILLCKIRGYKSVYVKMGIIEEFKYKTNRLAGLKYLIIRLLEKELLHRFETITVVSEGMRKYLQKKYGISPVHVAVLPCAVDQEVFGYRPDSRLEIRRDLRLEDRIVFVYSGIWAPWQCIQETIACFKLLKEFDERAFLLILSPDRELFHQYLSCLDSEDYRVLSVEHSFMDRYLSSADCGFLIRKRSIINRVASPLKFSEYLMCGLPIIIGPEVGDFSKMIQDEGLGVVIDPDRPEEWKNQVLPFLKQVSNDGKSLKNSCYHLAFNRFSWQRISQGLTLLESALDIGHLNDPIK